MNSPLTNHLCAKWLNAVLASVFALLSTDAGCADLTGTNVYVSGNAVRSDYLLQANSGYISGYVGNSDQVYLMTNSNVLPYTTRSFVEVQTGGVNIGSNQVIHLFHGTIDQMGTLTALNPRNGLYVSSAHSALYSQGSRQSTFVGWMPASSDPSAYAKGNGLVADASGTLLRSSSALTLSGSTISLNDNRLQHVAAGTDGTDAVNVNQLNALTNSSTAQFKALQSEVGHLQNQILGAERGIAGVTAMTQLPALSEGQQFNVGLGWGSFNHHNAWALGAHWRIKDNLIGKLSTSLSPGAYVTGVGVSMGF